MKHPLVMALAAVCTLVGVPAAEATTLPTTTPAWSASGDAGTTPTELAVSADGTRVYAAGRDGAAAWLVAYDAALGAERWAFTSRHLSVANAVAVTPDGNRIIIAGWVSTGGGERNSEMSIWALDRGGTNRWSARYTGNGADRGDFVADLAIAPNGTTVYATGLVWNLDRRRDLVVAAYRVSDGRLRWRRVIDSGPAGNGEGISEEGRAIAVTPDGASVIVTGYNARPAALSNERSRALTMAFAASSGATRWSANSTVADNAEKTPWGVDVAPHGSAVYVGGASWYYAGEESFATRHRLGDGRRTWSVRHDSEGTWTVAEAIVANGDGAYLTGAASSGAFYVWAQRASDGAPRWATSSALQGSAHDIALAVGGARVYVAGALAGGVGSATGFAVLGIDTADGSVDWVGARSPSDASPDDHAFDVALDPAGTRVYASGLGGPDTDALVVAFDI